MGGKLEKAATPWLHTTGCQRLKGEETETTKILPQNPQAIRVAMPRYAPVSSKPKSSAQKITENIIIASLQI